MASNMHKGIPNIEKWYGINSQQYWSMIEPEEYPCDCRLWLGEWMPFGYGIIHSSKEGVITTKTVFKNPAYRVAYLWSPFRGKMFGAHISHLCGLAPCCNPNHLIRINPRENVSDGWLHRRIFESFSEGEKTELQTSGMGFKESSKTLDIPGGKFIFTSLNHYGSDVLVFGAGAYRADNVYLSIVPAANSSSTRKLGNTATPSPCLTASRRTIASFTAKRGFTVTAKSPSSP